MTWTGITKPAGTNEYLLMETGDFLLQENGYKIVIAGEGGWTDLTEPSGGSWTGITRPSSGSWSGISKP